MNNPQLTYRQKRSQWLCWLSKDEYHAIWPQLASMIWDDLVFRVLSNVQESHPHGPTMNWLLALSLGKGYVAHQVLGIRRLWDKRQDVISLRRLRDDVCHNRPLLTRDSFVSPDGLADGGSNLDLERLHRVFDDLSGVPSCDRRPSDCVPRPILDKLNRWCDESKINEVVTWGNKFLMHAADPESRSSVSSNLEFRLRVEKIHRDSIRVAEAISIIISGPRHLGIVPVPQYNPFEGLDQPYATPQMRREFERLFAQLSTNRNAWVAAVFRDLTDTSS